jgi:hypothetical protein
MISSKAKHPYQSIQLKTTTSGGGGRLQSANTASTGSLFKTRSIENNINTGNVKELNINGFDD